MTAMRTVARPLPKNYRAIFEIVRERGCGTHLTVAEVYTAAKRRLPALGVTTVYRALARLRDTGLVAEIALPGADGAVYELAAEPHAHFRCDECGAIEDVAYAGEIGGVPHPRGAQVSGISITLHGRCAKCC